MPSWERRARPDFDSASFLFCSSPVLRNHFRVRPLFALTRPLPACGAQYSATGIKHAFSTRCFPFFASPTYRPPADIEYCPVQVLRQGHEVLVILLDWDIRKGRGVRGCVIAARIRSANRQRIRKARVKKGGTAFVIASTQPQGPSGGMHPVFCSVGLLCW